MSGNPDQRNKTGVIIHDIYRYTNLAPLLGKLDFEISKEETGTQTVPPNLPQVGLDRQAQCLSSTSSESDDSLLVCIVEIRYSYILSIMYYYFDGSTPSDHVEALIEQVITNTDKRIEEIGQHLGKSDS